MAIRSTFTTGEVLTAADLTDTIKGAFINTETTTARTLGTADAGNLVTLNNNSGGTVTIPTNTTWGSPLGTLVHLINIGTAGTFTVGTAAGVTLNAASATMAIKEGGTLIKTATNTWQFVKGGGLGKAQYSSTTGSPSITTVSGKTCVQFTGSGSITTTAGLVEVLVVGGGGGGGAQPSYAANGGGGAGQAVQQSSLYLAPGTHTITVGAGGAGGTTSLNSSGPGNASILGSLIVASGGGKGNDARGVGFDGANGGGCDGQADMLPGVSLSGGFAGGDAADLNTGGGGGGQGGAGGAGAGTTGGTGGIGIASSITGSSVNYAGGGGGGASTTGGTASFGGGAGGAGATAGTAGTANRGGGGGGGSKTGSNGGSGGSGIVILLFG